MAISSFRRVLLSTAFLASSMPVTAAVVSYDFEPPNFSNQETTPLLNRAPGSGPAGFLASFTSTGDDAGLVVGSGAPNNLFGGQFLVEPDLEAVEIDSLRVSLNRAVTGVQVDFATIDYGWLILLTDTGLNGYAESTLVGGDFPGGTLSVTSATPFTVFTLSTLTVLTEEGQRLPFAIDNLRLTTVPMPGTALLMALGLAGLGAIRRKKLAA